MLKDAYIKMKVRMLRRYYALRFGSTFLNRFRISRRRYLTTAFCLVIAAVLGISLMVQTSVRAKTLELGSRDIMEGYVDFNQVQTGTDNKTVSLQRGDIGKWEGGDGLQHIPTPVRGDTVLVYGPNNTLYAMVQQTGCKFIRYQFEVQRWEDVKLPPVGCGYGHQLVFDGTANMYYFPGNSSNDFFRYSIANDTWSSLADVPALVGDGASATYVSAGNNSAIFLMRGMQSPGLWQYNIQTNSWLSRASFPTTSSVSEGMSIVWDKNNSIYAISNHRGEFKRYSISTDTWSNLPAATNAGWQDWGLIWANNAVYNASLKDDTNNSHLTRFDPATSSWSAMASPPIGQAHGFRIVPATDGTDNIYTLMGYFERPILYNYKVSTNTWVGNSRTIQDNSFVYWEPMYDGGQNIYYVGGHGWGDFDKIWKKDLSTGTVTRIGSQPDSALGSVGAYYNNALYALRSYGGTNFGKFDLNSNDWVTLPNAPYNSDWGSDVIDGGDGYLYVTFGWRADFYRFSEGGGWQRMANLPRGIGAGGMMTRIGRTIYAQAGSNSPHLLRYNMDTNAWTYATDAPKGAIDHGGFLTSDGTRYLYSGQGSRVEGHNRLFYRYDTSDNSWKRMADLPQSTQVGAQAFYQTTTNKIWVTQGSTHSNMWSWTPTANNYVSTGSWYSRTLDLTQVSAWQSLNVSSSGSGTVTTNTRTSDNGNIWSDWQQVGGSSVVSSPKRYLQIRVTLSGDGSSSPQINGITLNYDQETAAPDLPSQFTAYDRKGGAALTSGTTYEHQHPYLSWAGANDGSNGSGIAGYYVYFGTESSADPVAAGTFQTNTDYTVTTAMTAGNVYYVRIKVKDNLGNVSDAATYFSYRYWYISPPGRVLKSSQSDFSQGVNSGLSISGDGTASLIKQSDGIWSTGIIKMMPENTNGPAMVVVDSNLYVIRGNSTGTFWRYDLEAGSWQPMANMPSNAGQGSALTWDGDNYIYAVSGGTTNTFYRYNIINNAWETLPALPAFAQPGSDIKFIGNNRIAIVVAGSSEFYMYDTAARTFSSKTSPPLTISGNTGSGMWYDGTDTIYVYFGPWDRWSINRKSLMSYSISQDTWRTLAAPPVEQWYAEKNLVSAGDGKLYVFGNEHTMNKSSNSMAMVYDIAKGTWSMLQDSKENVVRGTITSDNNRYIYIIPSIGNSRKIVMYDTWEKKIMPENKGISSWHRLPWDEQSAWNWQAGNASSAAYDGNGYMYAIGANEGTWSRFIKRSIHTGETNYLPSPPVVGIGGSLAYSNNILYYLPAANRTDFYRFNQSNLSWEKLAGLPGNIYRPGSQSLSVLKDGSLLAIAGNGNRIYRFVPDSGMGAWTVMSNAPGTILNGGARYDGNDYVYVLAGNNTTNFYRYSVSGNSWSTMAVLPRTANMGAAIIHKAGALYTTAGNNTNSMYIYDITNNSWRAGQDAPDYFRYGSDFIDVGNEYALVIAGQDSPDIWRFNFPGSDYAYSGIATHISEPMMTEGLFDYAGIQATISQPENTKIEFWTRTSADATNWNDWVIGDQIKTSAAALSTRVASTPQKYTQIKIILYSYDNAKTPAISDYALDYYFDTTPPSNPTVMNVYTDSSKGTAVLNNTWYNISDPLLDWPDPGEAGGATDGALGSNMRGYYVYLGTDPTAVPQTAGVFVSDTEYTPNLTTSGTYYLRMQAVDMTGNVDPDIFNPFIYKFDNTPPTNPGLIMVTPSGFTGNNNYTFEWPNGFDNNSGVLEYCYHTGALSGPFAAETCQSTTELVDVSAAYQPGANAFYLRTKDLAGNFSTTYTQASYYYSTDPPTPVTNLRAIPPSSEQNLFAFTWDYPTMYSGDPEQLAYCYSVNTLPTPTNTTCTGDKFISAFKAATQQGTNVIYMVAKDEAGNANWNNYAFSNFIANTVSPGIPLNLVLTDTSDSATERWSLTLTWNPPTFEGNGVANYVIERSEDGRQFTEIGRVSNTAYVDLTVEPEITYFYRVKAADNVDNQGGASAIVSLSARGSFNAPPKVISEPRVQPSFDQGTVNWVTDRASTSFVYYGTDPSKLGQSKGSLDLANEHAITLTGLLPATTYYYRVQSFDNERSYDINSATSQLYTFKTTESTRIIEVNSSDVGLESAVITWQTSVPTRFKIEYGPTSQYGFSQENTGGYTTNHVYRLAGLPSGTTLHYRISATTEYGSQVNSDDYVLTTISRPTISNIRFQPIEDGSTMAVKITWTSNVPTSSEVTYRGLGVKNEKAQGELVSNHEILIEDLASSTDYDFEIRGRDQYGNLVSIPGQKWKSGVDTKEPTISDLSITASTTSSFGGSKAQMIIFWRTDEPTTTQLQYDKASSAKFEKKTPLDTEPTVDHVVVVSGLDLAEVYKIQPIARDISGNTAYGTEMVTVTPDLDESPLDIILNVLQRVFRL